MALRTYFLLAATVVCCFTTLIAFPMDGFAPRNSKCLCQNTRASPIPTRFFKRIEILPPSAHCRNIEILITKKDNRTICVDPEAPWINKVLSKVMSKRAVRETAVPTVA